MEKLIYLIWGRDEAGEDSATRRLLKEAAPKLLALEPQALTIYANDGDADVPAPVPWPQDELPFVAEVAIWLDCYDRRGPVEDILAGVGERMAGYLVSESIYTEYGGNRHAAVRDWADGARSPGVVSVTLMEKPDRLSGDDWIAHWHGTQSPVSEEMQPRTRYVRNVVVRALTPDAPPYRGIVEEAWPSAEHVTDPMLFYGAEGSKERMQTNIERMLESVRGFLDLERIRNQTTSEYILKSDHGRGRFSRAELAWALDRYRRARDEASRTGDWTIWSQLFTADAHYVEHAYGELEGRKAIEDWITGVMAPFPNMTFPQDWWVIDEERGAIVFQCQNTFAHPTDAAHPGFAFPNWTRLVYAGDGLFRSEEDIYNPARDAGRTLKAWRDAGGQFESRERVKMKIR